MALNIKNERVHALAREAAARTGKSQTAVIQDALELLLRELPDPARDDEEALRRERAWAWYRSLGVTDAERAAVHAAMDEMYDDETGLPR